MESTLVLSLVAVAFIHLLFGMAILRKGVVDPLWITTYLPVVLLYASLYFHRLELHTGLRRRLRNAAVALAMLLCPRSSFTTSPLACRGGTAVAVWLFLATVRWRTCPTTSSCWTRRR
jgi:hypothetical protein